MILCLTFVPERRIVYVNPACYTITSYTPERHDALPRQPELSDGLTQADAVRNRAMAIAPKITAKTSSAIMLGTAAPKSAP